jgi:SAM-dependent methyltransferase
VNANEPLLSAEEAVLLLRGQPESQELVRACCYDDPVIEAARRFHTSSEWTALRSYLPAVPGRALDIGAGRGIASFSLASDGWNVTALEPDSSSVVGSGAIRDLARGAGINIGIVETWGENLPFPDESFDLVYCRSVLHHAYDLCRLCREVGRVLREGGTFIAVREHVISRKADLQIFLNNHPLHKLRGGESAYLLQEYIEAIRSGGIGIDHILNPKESDINLFPSTRQEMKLHLASKIGWPFPNAIPDIALKLYGAMVDAPGRLYSFIGVKSHVSR